MLTLGFAGWFQCRLATDPDPSDEPRGVSGWTFAVAGEPDLDRVIRMRSPVALRSHGPQVGVAVQDVRLDGRRVPDHPLLGATVDLLDDAKFEGRSGIVAEDAAEPIDPFRIEVSGGGITLRRRDVLALDDESRRAYQVDPVVLRRRQPNGFEGNSGLVRQVTGITDPVGYRRERRQKLEQDLQAAQAGGDAVPQAALQKRIEELDAGGIRIAALGFRISYGFQIRGPLEVIGGAAALGGRPDPAQRWPIDFWMGAWDADALCGFTQGSLVIPLLGSRPWP